jgi:hypothetical protein
VVVLEEDGPLDVGALEEGRLDPGVDSTVTLLAAEDELSSIAEDPVVTSTGRDVELATMVEEVVTSSTVTVPWGPEPGTKAGVGVVLTELAAAMATTVRLATAPPAITSIFFDIASPHDR